MSINEAEILNILMLGETGVGKSTAINALVNYLTYNSLSEATKTTPLYVIPTKFSLVDNNLDVKTIAIGEDQNENTELGMSTTRKIQSYLFNYKKHTLRLIDTPGQGDTRGMSYDEENTEKLLTFIGELQHLNAICILLKPNDSRFSVLFEYCLKHILTRLDKGVRSNIIFLFTNARSSFYTPGDTYIPLKTMLDQIKAKNLSIPLDKTNTFCIDNESFRYIVAKSKGFNFSEEDVEEFEKSWNKSSRTFKRMIDHILSLPPAPMHGTVTVNESRRLIGRLGKSIVKILTLSETAIATLNNHEELLKSSKNTLNELLSNLYIPVTHYQITEKSWHESHETGGPTAGVNISWKYPFISLDLGYQHTWSHTHYTEVVITPYVTNVEDAGMKKTIRSKEDALEKMKTIIEEMNALKGKYANERRTILRAAVRFAVFLSENAILHKGDVFENYLGKLLRDESTAGINENLIENLENVMVQYRILKSKTKSITPVQIKDSKDELLALQYSGVHFKELLEKEFTFNDKELK